MYSLLSKIKMYGLKQFLIFALIEIRYKFYYQVFKNSYSQSKEDLILDEILGNKLKGFYVDIGAYDPDRFNNTKRFYNRGWRGINIEPDKNNFDKFTNERNEDTNLNIGVGSKKDTIIFYKMFPSTLSTFSEKLKDNYLQREFKLEEEIKVHVDTLSNILDEHSAAMEIDFFSIDTEGYDLIVLKSNNWDKYKPKAICIETNKKNSKEIKKYLNNHGYKEVFDNESNSVYKLIS